MATVFGGNPRRDALDSTDADLSRLCASDAARFEDLPPFHTGQSAEIRKASAPGFLIQRFSPTLNSISQGRKGRVPGTDALRLAISRLFWRALHHRGLPTCHIAWHGDCVLITEERVPPVEVIVKAALVGTPCRIYHGLLDTHDRFGRPFEAGQRHDPYVRFDFRNPLRSASSESLRDECLPLGLADRLIDTTGATDTALTTFGIVSDLLGAAGCRALDACFLYDETGRILCYEISPDNMRIKSDGPAGVESFDKDLWRNHADPATILDRWEQLHQRLAHAEGHP